MKNHHFTTILCLLILSFITWQCLPVYASDTKPEEAFPVIKQDLEAVLRTSRKPDPQHFNYHFVLLLDTVRTSGPAWKAIQAVSDGLLDSYLVPGDRVSLVLFQNDVWSHSDWGAPFSLDSVRAVKKLYGPGPAEPNGGNDQEKALWTAIQATQVGDQALGDVIYIVLTDVPESQPPMGMSESQLTSHQPWFTSNLDKAHILKGRGNWPVKVTIAGADATSKPVTSSIYYTIYFSSVNTQLCEIKGGDRDSVVQSALPSTTGGNPQNIVPPVPYPVKATPAPVAPPDPVDPGLIAGIVCFAIIAGGGIFYLAWLYKARGVRIGPTTGAVKFGKPTYITYNGGSIELTLKSSSDRVALLKVDAMGAVSIRGESFYTLRNGKQILTHSNKSVRLRDQRTGEESHDFTACLIR